MNSTFLAFYAVSGIFTGALADKYNKNRLILLSYLLVAISTFSVGLMSFIPAQTQSQY